MKRLGRRNRKHPVPDPVVSLNHIRLKLSSAALWGRLLNLLAGWQTRLLRRLPIGAQDTILPHPADESRLM
jgi:hypothetical protein